MANKRFRVEVLLLDGTRSGQTVWAKSKNEAYKKAKRLFEKFQDLKVTPEQ